MDNRFYLKWQLPDGRTFIQAYYKAETKQKDHVDAVIEQGVRLGLKLLGEVGYEEFRSYRIGCQLGKRIKTTVEEWATANV